MFQALNLKPQKAYCLFAVGNFNYFKLLIFLVFFYEAIISYIFSKNVQYVTK